MITFIMLVAFASMMIVAIVGLALELLGGAAIIIGIVVGVMVLLSFISSSLEKKYGAELAKKKIQGTIVFLILVIAVVALIVGLAYLIPGLIHAWKMIIRDYF